jgi:hypothetical protein
MERYRLFCFGFSKEFAFNLWEGWLRNSNKKFLKGFVFNGEENIRIITSKVNTQYQNSGIIPERASISVIDKFGKRYHFDCCMNLSIPVPPKQSILCECLSEMAYNGTKSYGLSEYLFHEPNLLNRGWVFLKLLRYA